MKNDDDLPKSIIVILVILAVAISILGTFTVVSEVRKVNSAPEYQGSPEGSAKVSLQVINPNDKGMATTTGQVMFQVTQKPEEN